MRIHNLEKTIDFSDVVAGLLRDSTPLPGYGDVNTYKISDLVKFFVDLEQQNPGCAIGYSEDYDSHSFLLISSREETQEEQAARVAKAKDEHAIHLAKLEQKIKKLEAERDSFRETLVFES